MPELIDRQALIKDMCNNKTDAKCPCYPNCYPCDFSEARRIIDIQTTIESEPVRHGRWIIKPYGSYGNLRAFCSACGKHSGIGGIESNQRKPFCPNCGARMDATDTNDGGKGGDDNGNG